ncbi:MAG: choice-of-anchor B family protein [Actinobacteria bacterium]|nr:choice-of-anchor B family protein [Actinomycetota bacterium]
MRRSTVSFVLGMFAVTTVGAAPFLFDRQDHREHLHKELASTSALAAANAERLPEGRLSDVACRGGKAGPFACDGVDLLSFVPLDEFRAEGSTAEASDIWGWTDAGSGDEYVIITKTDGTSFFRITDPTQPVYLGDLPNDSPDHLHWHDVKIYEDHAYIVSESPAHLVQIFDLTRLRGVTEARTWDADALYPLNISAHNIAINEETGFAYVVGGNDGVVGPDQCLSGLHMIDLSEPKSPAFAGCYADSGGPGLAGRIVGGPVEDNSPAAYVHDTQCVNYKGPHKEYQGREICLNSSEDELTIVDVHDKSATRTISVLEYPDVAYAHQGWLTEDHRYFLLGDELDEMNYGMNTRTLVFDVSNLEEPTLHFEHLHDTRAIDHNMYTHEKLLYQSNYTAGLRVLDTSFLADKRLPELASFDVFPGDDDAPVAEFAGTWSNYPYFASGTVAVSSIGEGLFLLKVQDGVFKRIGETKEKPGRAGGGKVALGPPTELDAFFAIGCVTEGEDPRCVSTSYALSEEVGDNSVGNLLALTPANEALYRFDGDEPTQPFPADGTLPSTVKIRTDQPVTGEIAIHTWQRDRVGAGLTTVYVEVFGTRDGRRVLLGNATSTQPVLPTGAPTVFPFEFEIDPELEGVAVSNLVAGVAVRGVNAFAGFIDGVGRSTITVPTYR